MRLLLKVDDRPLGGASMDPFRSLAPALLAGGKPLREVWIFIVGPMVGAVLAALLTFMLGSRVHPYAMLDANGTHRTRTRARSWANALMMGWLRLLHRDRSRGSRGRGRTANRPGQRAVMG